MMVSKNVHPNTESLPPALPLDNRRKTVKMYPVLSLREVLKRIGDKCGKTDIKKYGHGLNYVVILPKAWEELKAIIDWGKRTPANVYEQLYQGMGYYFNNTDGKRILVVTHFLYIYAANRSPVSACIFEGTYDSIMQRVEYERNIYSRNEARYNVSPEGYVYNPFVNEYGSSEVILYGHTHPNLGVFFSSDDRTSGFATPDMPAAIFVADPIRLQLKAAVGVEQGDAQVIVCSYCSGLNGKAEKEEQPRETGPEKLGSSEARSEDELIAQLCQICTNLLDSQQNCVKGYYSINTTMTGKEHIKVDILLGRKTTKHERSVRGLYPGEMT